MNNHDWKNYVGALVITIGIFVTVILFSHMIADRKIASIKQAQDNIAIDIMSSETQFSVVSDLSCTDDQLRVLESQLGSIEEKINYSETNHIGSDESLATLKKYYDILEIKDFLLTQKINQHCGTTTNAILYVYTNADACDLCTKEGYVLSALREKHPDLRVYSFNYSTDLSALSSLLTIYKIKDTALPATVIDGKVYTGYYSLEDLEALLPTPTVKKTTTTEVAPKKSVKK